MRSARVCSFSLDGLRMTQQSMTNLCFSVFAMLLLAYVILVQWSGDVQQGAFRNPDLVRWANRVIGIPTIIFGLFSGSVGVRTLRARKYPPPGMVVPFPPKPEANWNPVSAGVGLMFGGACTAVAPIVIASVVGI
jgi:hypothetical protein